MVIQLNADLEAVLNDTARRRGITAEELVLQALGERYLSPAEPRDDWERRLLAVASDCGVALSHEALGSEGLSE